MENKTTNTVVGLCSDHAGYELKAAVRVHLEAKGFVCRDFGTHSVESCDYPDFAHPCAVAVEAGECAWAVAICGTGNGIGITLNKHQGIRAALCWQPELAALARAHNNANVIVLPARFIEPAVALQCIDSFIDTPFEGGRHQRRIDKIPVK